MQPRATTSPRTPVAGAAVSRRALPRTPDPPPRAYAPAVDLEGLARTMLDAAEAEEQCVRTVPDDADAVALRDRLRVLARDRRLRIRTARMGDTVAVVRADAAVWHEDAATMRRKLAPSD